MLVLTSVLALAKQRSDGVSLLWINARFAERFLQVRLQLAWTYWRWQIFVWVEEDRIVGTGLTAGLADQGFAPLE